ncbi:hypothetical protein C922_03607 [Plasmodium inui San Antonio 1]|uniref:Uncharacterized protein n=1 Tax=Plasmodium inui San Antonio 1 TaxID=1237626 RepID=W7A3F7_9APIC|nr:hypothetical protein C922_03607 [Plasmodium inui San Antonio 1]EUD65883.1 hypothetical protein C922_03607 [Plasmodium inui San Antonio 1]
MHNDIKNDIIRSLPFTFSKVELDTCDGRRQKGESRQNKNNDAPAHGLDGNEDGHTDESSYTHESSGTDESINTDGNSPPEGTDEPNCYECAGGGTGEGKRRKRKQASKNSPFNDQGNKHHSHEEVFIRNRQKENSAKKSAPKPPKQHQLCAHTRGRETTGKIKEGLSMSGMQKDTQGVGERGNCDALHYSSDAFKERAYVTLERSKLKNWRVQNYLDVDRLSLSVSTSSMGGKATGEEDDLSSDGASPARRATGRGNDIFGESLFSSFNLNYDPFGGGSDPLGARLGEHLGEGFPTDAGFNAGMRDGPNRTDTDETGAEPPLEMDTIHSMEEDKQLPLFDSLKNLYTNHNKKIKLINYSKILNTSLCKRVQDVVEGQQDKVLETSSGGNGRKGNNSRKDRNGKKHTRSRGDPSLGQKMTEHNVKAIIMNIKKRLGFYSGEERQETHRGSQMEMRKKNLRHQKRRDKRYHVAHENKPTFSDSLNYSRDEPLSDSVTNELCTGEEKPDSVTRVDAANESVERRIHKGDSQNLLNYQSFVSDDFNLSDDKDGPLGSFSSRKSQGENLPSSSEGCASTHNEEVFALSTSSAQFKQSFLRAIGRVSTQVDRNEGTDEETHAEEKAHADEKIQADEKAQVDDDAHSDDGDHADCDNPSTDLSHGDTPTNKQTKINCQKVLKREEFPIGTDPDGFGTVTSSGESPPKERIINGERDHSRSIQYSNEDIKKDEIKKLISCTHKNDDDRTTPTGGSPMDFATERQQESTSNEGNSQRDEKNDSNKLGKMEGMNILSEEMNAYMLDVFDKQVKHLNELVTNVLS